MIFHLPPLLVVSEQFSTQRALLLYRSNRYRDDEEQSHSPPYHAPSRSGRPLGYERLSTGRPPEASADRHHRHAQPSHALDDPVGGCVREV